MEAADQSQSSRPGPIAATKRPGLRALLTWAPALAAGLVLRLWMLKDLFQVNGDPEIYGELAKNLLLHGQYGQTLDSGAIASTLIRLPGYPLFLALCFSFFGVENYFASTVVQIVLELAGCVLLADFAARIAPKKLAAGARLATLWIAVLCPFTASYAAVPMAETLTLFALALAMWSMARFLDQPRWGSGICFALAISYTALLRPDGILAAFAFVPPVLIGIWRGSASWAISRQKLIRIALVCCLLALAPFAGWTWRNWRTFHVLEPLAPRYAVDPGDDSFPGWQHWIKTWCLDFVSTYNVYWPVPGAPLELNQLPNRAFDSPQQYAETAALASYYNSHGQEFTPAIDAQFEHLARERIAAHPLRYYLWLPLGRMADMWLRPRVENLNIDLDWWVYSRHRAETRFSWYYVALNALYLVLGAVGLCLRPRFGMALLAYMLLRSALLLTVEAPEARYTLECFPILFVLGGIALSAAAHRAGAGFRRAT
jgi:hypothetical protein